MSIYEKARELGEMILETDEGKRLYDAKFVYQGDEDAKSVLSQYMQFRNALQVKMQSGELSEEEFKVEFEKLKKFGEDAKKNEVVAELMAAEEQFNRVVNSVLGILKETVLKDDEEAGGCSGSCSSCSGCH